jgi:hypothetical protein
MSYTFNPFVGNLDNIGSDFSNTTVTNYLSTNNVLISGLTVVGNISSQGNVIGNNITQNSLLLSGGNLFGSTNTLEQRNGLSAQTFRIFNTYTATTGTAVSGEFGYLRWLNNTFQIGTSAQGNGQQRALELQTNGITRMTVSNAGQFTFSSNISGNSNNIRTAFSLGSATGNYSFAVNRGRAFGDYSHAEGDGSVASGWAGHAEGQLTVASGNYSHAEGYGSQSTGNMSHAEGSFSKAIGLFSHAEGNSATASGIVSHAEGSGTVAPGDYGTHAEGEATAASGNTSHTEGYRTVTGQRVYFQSYTASSKEFTFSSANSGFFDYIGDGLSNPNLAVYTSGQFSNITVASRNTLNGNITATSNVLNFNIGPNTGYIVTASGYASHAEGSDTTASGIYSHAEGDGSVASGWAGHAEGQLTVASGNYSHAEGNTTTASGFASHAAGFRATAAQDYTYAWSDGSLGTATTNVSTTRSGQYMVSASGGVFIPGKVGIGIDCLLPQVSSNALTVVGNISATGVVFASGGNSNQWNTNTTIIQSNSSNWNSAYQQTSASDLVRSNTTFETPTTGLSTIQNIVSLSLETYNNLTVKLPGTLYVVV